MINKVAINNFKSLKNIQLDLAPLNILAGLNGSGKSSLIQSLLLLHHFLCTEVKSGLNLKINKVLDLGVGGDVFYQFAGREETIEFLLENDVTKSCTWQFRYEMGSDMLPLATNLPNVSPPIFPETLQYLNTEHLFAKDGYPRSESHIRAGNIGPKGEYAAHYLAEYGISKNVHNDGLKHPQARSSAMIHQVDAWLSEVSPGVRLIAEDVKNLDQVRLAFKFETRDGFTNEVKPVNTGFGISYALPVVVAVLKANKGDLVVIENPESHLHPRGQSVLGRLIACAAQEGIQFIVETHSDHLINGVRVAVKNGLPSSAAKVFYFTRILDQSEQYSQVEEIRFDRQGELSSYPRGFLDEWNEQLMQLI